jgi:hypothetical protein
MKLITIATYTNVMTATIVESRLKSEGIECRIQRNFAVDLAWATPPLKHGYEIQVLEEDLKTALAIVAEFAND